MSNTPDSKQVSMATSVGRIGLLIASTIMVFGSSFLWICYVVAILLWAFVLGDDFRYYGLLASALGVPLSVIPTYAFLRRAKKCDFHQSFSLFCLSIAIVLLIAFYAITHS